MKNILGNPWVKGGIILILGIGVGWLVKPSTQQPSDESDYQDHQHINASESWTCSMHPQISLGKPGQCPICGMDLIPVTTGEEDDEGPTIITMSEAAMRIAEVETSVIEKIIPFKEVYLSGKVKADERRITRLTAHFPGRIEELYVNYTGQKVKSGQVLARIYSPELMTAQKELFEAVKLKETNPQFYQAARNKLKLWVITDPQINQIESSGEIQYYYNILSPISGTVTKLNIANGDHVMEGMSMFEIIDLKHVWVLFDGYESDLPWVKLKDEVQFTIKSIPGRVFSSTITFVDPVINPNTRVAYVRTELKNPDEILKPEMFANGVLKSLLSEMGQALIVPKSAVLWTGKKAVVYVKNSSTSKNMFSYREITLGEEAGAYYVVKEGLQEGEEIATNGVFKIDAAAQLQGKPSMMNPTGGKVTMAHDHGSMGGNKTKTSGEDHSQHQKASEDHSVMDMGVPEKFKEQLTAVYNKYLDMKASFIASNPSDVKKASTEVSDWLTKVNMGLLNGEMHNMWMGQLKALSQNLKIIQSENDIEKQRLAFADFNEIFYKSVKHFGLKDKTVYYQFCPMARESKGAYWLSEIEEIKNPYFGDRMLTCGSIKETIQSN
ncbi:MAG: efflux RND transporter periplasmic adaptor subunit [Bacteroidetes bacterium]|nr:efflux RND transporter periplasmic adaptor subunit [Bacteroidota bacterium]